MKSGLQESTIKLRCGSNDAQVPKRVRYGYRGGRGHIFFAELYLKFILYFHKENPIFLYNFCQKWLDTLKTTHNP